MPQTVDAPTRHHYGEWHNFFGKLGREAIFRSTRDYLDQLDEYSVHYGHWKQPDRWPWVYIRRVRVPIQEANVSGGRLHAMFAYDIIVENTNVSDMDLADEEAMNILGDIIALLKVDMKEDMTLDNVRYARRIEMDLLDPIYVEDPQTSELFTWARLRLMIFKRLALV